MPSIVSGPGFSAGDGSTFDGGTLAAGRKVTTPNPATNVIITPDPPLNVLTPPHGQMDLGVRNNVTINTNQDEAGYKGNKKGFSVTETGWSTQAYLVNSMASSTGSQAVIDIWFGDDGANELQKGPRLVPQIPYRFTFSDSVMLDLLKVQFSKQPQEGGASTRLLYNPEFDRGDYGDASAIDFNRLNNYKEDTERYEVNLLRGDESRMIGRAIRFWNSPDSQYGDLYITPRKIRMDDYQVGMIVIPEDDDIDIMYLAVCSRVTVQCSRITYQNESRTLDNKQLEWSVPIILKYRINKVYWSNPANAGKTSKLVPTAWGYPASVGYQYDIKRGVGAGLENVGMIMGRRVKGTTYENREQYAWWPMDLGVVCDIDWNQTHSRLEIACARAETTNIVRAMGSYYTSTHFYHYNENFYYDNKYNSISTRSAYGWNSAQYPENIQITMDGDIAWITGVTRNFADSITKANPRIWLESRQTGLNQPASTKIATMFITDADDPDICISSTGERYFHCVDVKNDRSLITTLPAAGTISSYFNNPEAIYVSRGAYRMPLKDTYSYSWSEELERIYRPFAGDMFVSKITSNGGPLHKMDYRNRRRYMVANRAVGNYDIISYQDVDSKSSSGLRAYDTRDRLIDKGQTISYVYLNRLEAVQMSGVPTGQSFAARFHTNLNSKGLCPYEVTRVAVDEFRFGKPVVEYWRDFVFGSGYWKNDDKQWDEDRGIRIQVNVTGCYGIRSNADPLTTSDWDASAGGIKINTTYRPDMDFKYYGTKEKFEEYISSWRGGYWAQPQNQFEVTCKYKGENLIAGITGDKLRVHPGFWGYHESGVFNCYLPMKIKTPIDENNHEFTHPDYVLSGVVLTAHAYNRWGMLLDSDTFTMDIDPPNPTGYIRSDVYKTIGDITFNYYRNSQKSSTTYTEIHDIVKFTHAQNGEGVKNSQPSALRAFNQDTGTYTISKKSLTRGEGVHYTYLPKLYGIKPEANTQITKAVTFCGGHQYSLGDVALHVGVSGSFGDNILSKFDAWRTPYQYVDIDHPDMEFKAIVDINHENWNLSTPRSNYADINVYPGISGIYLYAIEGLQWGPAFNENNRKQEFLPVPGDNTKTYPNVKGDFGWGKFWWVDHFQALSLPLSSGDGIYATGLYLPGTSASVTSQEIIVPIWKSGRYRVYLTIEDEFGQFSEFCLTNPTFYYNHPFEAVNG